MKALREVVLGYPESGGEGPEVLDGFGVQELALIGAYVLFSARSGRR